jgi:hypothetical protein
LPHDEVEHNRDRNADAAGEKRKIDKRHAANPGWAVEPVRCP